MNEDKQDIIAVILTHNRKDMLLQGIHGLLNQSRPLDMIIIVDSVSTDGTYDCLLASGVLDKAFIKYVRLEENKGPSGGFAQGIAMAQSHSPSWIWILDDDIVAAPTCLENLLKHKGVSRCIAPSRDEKTVPLFNPAVGFTSHSKALSFSSDKDVVFSNTCCFEGMLIHGDIVEKAGLPDERFFQVNGDTIYGFVVSLFTNIAHVKNASITRLLPQKKPLSNRRAYLLIRNHFLTRDYLKQYGLLRPSLFYINFALIVFYYSTIVAFRTKSPGMPFAVLKGLFHGIFKKFGAPQ